MLHSKVQQDRGSVFLKASIADCREPVQLNERPLTDSGASMHLLFRVVFAAACKSTHHKLALDALRYLRGPDATHWQKLFLKHYERYLTGSKAPDTQFKDFRNHVLHVRDNYWGGAPRTARKWYRCLIDDLRAHDWGEAAFSAGVLSHYYTDPIQPFHTGQSSAESKIHRAAEWSITKSYDTLRDILEHEKLAPTFETPSGDDWLEAMVIAGAEFANPHYEELIERYDFERGVKDPPSGLDTESRRILAPLIGHAAIGFARILERAFEEAEVPPPEVSIGRNGSPATLRAAIPWR
jgi:hypothetical protein